MQHRIQKHNMAVLSQNKECLAGAQGMLAGYQTLMNHAGDADLRKLLEDIIQQVIQPEIEQTKALLQ
ncbi:hypothetical protein, partial [Acinetobacter baumannii]|uniref:hypothetical protein n=1 Tax=Acinetobacter baumannii TaxID=470 RepID=UPI000AE930E3